METDMYNFMPGDLFLGKINVQRDRNYYIIQRVYGINVDTIISYDRDMSNKRLEYNKETIKPIPLTDEILKFNGYHEHATEHDYKVIYDLYTLFRTIDACKYVHEFQQLLRLAGLPDKADTFKLETNNIKL